MIPVSDVRVDDEGIFARAEGELVLDVLFDERRIWSFWLPRDGIARDGGYDVPWPGALRRFLRGSTRLQIVTHVDQQVVYDAETRLGDGDPTIRIAVVNDRGLPLGIDKSQRLAQTFDTRSAEHVAPLLDSIDEVLGALRKAGIEPFVAYGTLLGAVRGGKLIGHDSDADLGYVSRHTHPVDVVRESFDLQRTLADMGYAITRYSGIAFKVDVVEGDGSVRGLDVFGGFLGDGPPAPDGGDPDPLRAGVDLPARHDDARRSQPSRCRRTPTGSSPRPTARAGRCRTRRTSSRRRSPRTVGSTAGSAAPGSSARSGTAPTPATTSRASST